MATLAFTRQYISIFKPLKEEYIQPRILNSTNFQCKGCTNTFSDTQVSRNFHFPFIRKITTGGYVKCKEEVNKEEKKCNLRNPSNTRIEGNLQNDGKGKSQVDSYTPVMEGT